MKKVSLLVLICMLASIMLATLTSCAEVEHTHEYGEEWIMDKTNHYHVCSCGEKSESAKHADANNDEACDVCGITMNHTAHNFGDAWAFDAENHYNACSECGAKNASAAHADTNNDGACDTCAVIMTNNHVYDPAWTSDAANHWHAVLCGHTVDVKDKAAHTPDALGECTVCGYKVSAPDVSTVEKAIEIATLTQGSVLGGKITIGSSYYTMSAYYECGNGYFHAWMDSSNVWVTDNGDGTVCYVATSPYGSATVIKAEENTKYLKGLDVDLQQYVNVASTTYGPIELLTFFFEDYLLEAPEGEEIEVTESVENGVHSFSYTMPVSEDSSYQISVEFTFDADEYYLDELTVSINDGNTTNTITYEQWITPESNHTPEDITPDATIKFENSMNEEIEFNEEGVATETLETYVQSEYYSTYIYVKDVTPSNALLEALGISTVIKDSNGEESYMYYCEYNTMEKAFIIDFYSAGEYTIEITIGETTYKIPTNVSYLPHNEITVNRYNDAAWEHYPTRTEIIYVGEMAYFFADFGDGRDQTAYTVTLIGDNADDATVVEDGTDRVYGYFTYAFSSNVAGTYTLQFTSTEDEYISRVVTVMVLPEPPTVADAAQGKWTFTQVGGAGATVNFYPTNETKGVITVSVTVRGNTMNAVYTYNIVDEVLIATYNSGDESAIAGIGVNSSNNVEISMSPGFWQELTYAGEADADPGNLPEAPDYTPGPSVLPTDSPIYVDSDGTQVFEITLAAGDSANFYIDNYTMSADYLITATGDATIDYNYNQYMGKTPITPSDTFEELECTDYTVYLVVTNTGAAEATITITITASNVVSIPE